MKLDEKTSELVSDLEYILGNQCYNPNSYDGYTGEEGAEFRYPVNIYRNNELRKYRSRVSFLTPKEVRTMRYHFGSNHLYVGQGIVKMLEFIERKYNIDFNKLEENIHK